MRHKFRDNVRERPVSPADYHVLVNLVRAIQLRKHAELFVELRHFLLPVSVEEAHADLLDFGTALEIFPKVGRESERLRVFFEDILPLALSGFWVDQKEEL